MNLICLAIDRLHAGYLGCYGNSWVGTPHVDALAAEALLLEQMTIDTSELASLVTSLWQGQHAAERPSVALDAHDSLPRWLADAGLHTALMSDEPAVLGHPLAAQFEEQISLPQPRLQTAEQMEATHLAGMMASAVEWLDDARQPFGLWLHTGSFGRAWDAPLELRNRYADEDEPPPPGVVEVPSLHLPVGFDPDERLGYSHAYAGQIALFDTALGMLTEAMLESDWGRETLLVLLGVRGLPLGLHGELGARDEQLTGELVHVPFIIRWPAGQRGCLRSSVLAQSCDVPLTLLDALGAGNRAASRRLARSLLPQVDDPALAGRPCSVTLSAHEAAIRTRAWYLRQSHTNPAAAHLFAKPDDFWELNEIADRAPDVVAALQALLAEYRAAASGEAPLPDKPLPELLTSTWR